MEMKLDIEYILHDARAFLGLIGSEATQEAQAPTMQVSIRGGLAKFRVRVSTKRLLDQSHSKIRREVGKTTKSGTTRLKGSFSHGCHGMSVRAAVYTGG